MQSQASLGFLPALSQDTGVQCGRLSGRVRVYVRFAVAGCLFVCLFVFNMRHAWIAARFLCHESSLEKGADCFFFQVPLKIQQKRNSVSVGGGLQNHAGRRLDSFHGESSHRRPPHQWCVTLAVTGSWSLEYNGCGSCAAAARASGCCPPVESLTLSQTLSLQRAG